MASRLTQLTTGDIARELNQSRFRVRHILESRGIEPTQKVGGYRVYSRSALKAVRQAIRELEQKKREAND